MSDDLDLAQQKRPVLLRVDELAKVYTVRRGLLGRKKQLAHALAGVSLDLKKGETLGVVGESGSGKSTLGKAIVRLVEPTYGRIVFDGVDITHLPDKRLIPFRKRMQIVFQDPYSSLNPRMIVRELVGEGLQLFRLAKGTELSDRVGAALARVGLGMDMLDRYPSELSGGQRQRVAIARTLAVEPELVICDEPTSALDVSVQAQILNLLSEIQSDSNVAYVFISHDLRVVELMSHRMAVLYLGKIVEMGPSHDVAERRLHPYTRALFDASPVLGPGVDGKTRLLLKGEPPSANAPPSGCAFHPRCPRAETGKCDLEAPPLRSVKDNLAHQVACFFPG